MGKTPETLRFYRRNLPHWLVADATFFVTIRLHGSVPRKVLADLAEERAELKTKRAGSKQWHEYERREFAKIEKILDACGSNAAWLTAPGVAQLVMDNLRWLENSGWDVFAAVVMSNHAHILFRNVKGRSAHLLSDLGQFKNFTGRIANRMIGRKGAFWAREDFDHWLRSADKFDSVVQYIAQNPVKAGLVKRWREWPWVYLKEDMVDIVDEHTAAS